jgi:phospholipid/cholesterol/gamma-HCH transport system substrate-binding protein
LISSESLLGGRYLALEPGADEATLPENGHIQFTQAPQNLEQLLGKFIFSVSESKDKGGEEPAAAQPVDTPAISPRVEDAPAPADAAPAESEAAHP